MQMRMIKQLRGPGLQDTKKPDASPDKTLVGGHLFERLCRCLEENGITNLLMRTEEFPECRRQRKGGKEIGNRQEPVILLFQPAFGFIPTAFWAVAVIARVVGVRLGFTVWAVIPLPAHDGSPALPDVGDCSPMGGRHLIAIQVKIRLPKTMEQFGEPHLDYIAHYLVNR